MKAVWLGALAVALGLGGASRSVHASVLSFEVFDPALSDAALGGDFPFEDSSVQPYQAGYGYPEGYRYPVDSQAEFFNSYGDNVESNQHFPDDPGGMTGRLYQYDGDLADPSSAGYEGTPDVQVSYGPYSFFTGGPALWRGGYGDLDGVLYQASEGPIGTDYNVLDIVLVANPGFDVVLHGFDLAASLNVLNFFGLSESDAVVDVAIFSGIPFPFLTPSNFLTPPITVAVSATTHTDVDFPALPPSQMIWIRIDANGMGNGSQAIGLDNLRFTQVENTANVDPIDLGAIDDALQTQAVPEATSLAIWAIGGAGAALVALRRRRAA
jgi:hypothetical protein